LTPIGFLALGLYLLAPWLLNSYGAEAPPALLAGAISLNLMGTFLHFGSDAQKQANLQDRPGPILDGFFRYSRNPNYLGENLIYPSFVLGRCTGNPVWCWRPFSSRCSCPTSAARINLGPAIWSSPTGGLHRPAAAEAHRGPGT
jgi:hypothetical protein